MLKYFKIKLNQIKNLKNFVRREESIRKSYKKLSEIKQNLKPEKFKLFYTTGKENGRTKS